MRNSLAAFTLMLLANSSYALDIHWNGHGGLSGDAESWQNVSNWDRAGSPFSVHRVPSDSDTATLQAFTLPFKEDVRLFANTAPINGLTVRNGYDLFTNGFLVEVDNAGLGNMAVTEGGKVIVESRVDGGLGLRTDNLLVTGQFSRVDVDEGDALVEGNTVLLSLGGVRGDGGGHIRFGGNVTLNQGILRIFDLTVAEFTPNTTVAAEAGAIIDLHHPVNINDSIVFDLKTAARLEPQSLNIGNNGNGVGSVGTLLLDSSARADVNLDLTIGHPTTGTGLLVAKDSFATAVGDTTIFATGTMQLDNTTFGAFGDFYVDGGTVTAINEHNPIFLDTDKKLFATNGGNISIDGNQSIRSGGLWDLSTGAGLEVSGTMAVGTHSGDPGTLAVDGVDTTLNLGADLVVGEEQLEGMVTLSSGAVATVSGNIAIAPEGMGALAISSGAALSGGFARIGGSPSSTGTATVTGAGSTWTNSSFLSIGSSGSGELNIEAGGQVVSAAGFVASDSNSTGTVTVSGEDSFWNVGGSLKVGEGSFTGIGGNAALYVETGGAVNVGATLSVHANDKLHLTGGTLTTQTLDLKGGQFNWTGGTLHAEMVLDNIVNQGGTLAPGKSTPGEEIGLTTIDADYTQQAGAALALQIAGIAPITGYDQVSFTGSALLDGHLVLSLLEGFQPQSSGTFTVLSALGGIAGVFDNVLTGERLDTIDGFGSFLVNYGPGSAFDDHQIVLSDFLTIANSADLNMDRFVDGLDLGILLGNFDQTAAPGGGELNGTPPVDGLDLGILLGDWNPSAPFAPARSVPEPNSALLILGFSLCLLLQRRHSDGVITASH